MFRLTREVRFSITEDNDEQLRRKPTNSYAGFPSLAGLGYYFTLRVTLRGEPEVSSNYLRNIKEVDQVVRREAVPLVAAFISRGRFGGGGLVVSSLFDHLKDCWPGVHLDYLKLSLSPFLSIAVCAPEHPMVRLSQKFEFSASHRLHNPELSDEANLQAYGKCNNPAGHGHNYEVQVTLRGRPNHDGVLIEVTRLEGIVASTVIERFDHRHLNQEVPEFKNLIPTVENIAMVIYKLLKPRLSINGAELAAVTVWETPKTWCEYAE